MAKRKPRKTTRTRRTTKRKSASTSARELPLPSPRSDVPRPDVPGVVELMLLDERVGDVDCREQSDGRYTIRPSASQN